MLTLALLLAAPQIQSQRPVQPRPTSTPDSFTPDAVETVTLPSTPPPQQRPAGAYAISPDGKSWITSIDGKRRGLVFSLGSRHIIRGHGLKDAVGGWITGSRMIFRGRGKMNRAETTGSVLRLTVRSDSEVVATVTQIQGGKVRWSAFRDGVSPDLTLLLRVAGGGQEIRVPLAASRYACVVGEPNCE